MAEIVAEEGEYFRGDCGREYDRDVEDTKEDHGGGGYSVG